MKNVFNTAYGSKDLKVRINFPEQGRTKQSHKKECDVNQIMMQFRKTGVIAHRNEHEPKYDDHSGISFTEAMQIVTESQQMFEDLPSHIRKRFSNQPEQFLDFVQDPQNNAELIKMGLAKAKIDPITGLPVEKIALKAEPKKDSITEENQPKEKSKNVPEK